MNQQTLLQKLVDGELTPEQRESFVNSLDGSQWKTVALAFVENQILDEQIPHIAPELQPPRKECSAVRPVRLEPVTGRHRLAEGTRVLAVVLLGVLCASIGYAIATWSMPSEEHLVTPSGSSVDSKSPLSLDDALSRCSMPIPENFRLNLLEAGYIVKENETISDVSLPFGGTIKIPIRQVNIEYHGMSTYQ